jgi:uncharacterized protein (TIGR02246 family)
METWEIEARECIRDLVARYNASGDGGRFDAMLELFAEDAVLEVPGQELRGRAAIRAFLTGIAATTRAQLDGGVKLIRHFTATHQIDVTDREHARGRCYYAVLTDRGLDHWGRYIDEYRCVEGRWLFWQRRATVDGRAPGSWSESVRG